MRLPQGAVLEPGKSAAEGARSGAERSAVHWRPLRTRGAGGGLERPATRQAGHTQHAAIQVNASGQGGGATAAAMSQALGELADRIAAEL